jgi:hypothetical protein
MIIFFLSIAAVDVRVSEDVIAEFSREGDCNGNDVSLKFTVHLSSNSTARPGVHFEVTI